MDALTIILAVLVVVAFAARSGRPRAHVALPSAGAVPGPGDAGGEGDYLFYGGLRGGQASVPAPSETLFVAVCEVDRFEAIRRSVGYAIANASLARLSSSIRAWQESAEVGRSGRASIEFAFRAASAEAAAVLLDDLIGRLSMPLDVDRCELDLTVRIGFAGVREELGHAELIERVEAALRDRARGEQRVVCVDAATDDPAGHRIGLLRDLHHAIASDALELHYQPKLRCRTETVDAVEALVRWQHPHLGAIRPDEFIGIAEETGLIRRLTDWTLDRAIRDQRRLATAGHRVGIHVNISGQLLPDRAFAAHALETVAAGDGEIGFEITETAVIDNPERALANLQAFTAAGIKIAIDDYGSGLSSLAYLKQLPAHELKIDRLFIDGLTNSHRDPLLVRSSIDLAHALEMEVTAEGVDDAMALSLLRVMGCDLVQGYLVAPPLPLDDLIAFLDRGSQTDHIATSPAKLLFGRSAG